MTAQIEIIVSTELFAFLINWSPCYWLYSLKGVWPPPPPKKKKEKRKRNCIPMKRENTIVYEDISLFFIVTKGSKSLQMRDKDRETERRKTLATWRELWFRTIFQLGAADGAFTRWLLWRPDRISLSHWIPETPLSLYNVLDAHTFSFPFLIHLFF